MTDSTLHQHLDNEYLLRLGSLSMVSLKVLEGVMAGRHHSPYHGYSAEFSEYRAYSDGEDLKNLDWKVLARSEKWVCKQYRDETNTSIHVAIDTSASMDYSGAALSSLKSSGDGQQGISKLTTAAVLAASLCHLARKQRDAFGLITGASALESMFVPRGSNTQLSLVFEKLEKLKGEGRTDFASLCREWSPHVKSGSILYLFSDLWNPANTLLDGLRCFDSRTRDIHVVHLITPREAAFFDDRNLNLRDLETGEELKIHSPETSEQYKSNLDNHIAQIRSHCIRANIHFHSLSTADSFFDNMRHLLHLSSRNQK